MILYEIYCFMSLFIFYNFQDHIQSVIADHWNAGYQSLPHPHNYLSFLIVLYSISLLYSYFPLFSTDFIFWLFIVLIAIFYSYSIYKCHIPLALNTFTVFDFSNLLLFVSINSFFLILFQFCNIVNNKTLMEFSQ